MRTSTEERTTTPTIGSATSEERETALDGGAYPRSTVGLDYTLHGGWYANAQ